MKRVIRSTITLAIAGGIAAVAAVLVGVDRRDLVLDAYLVFVAALLAVAAMRIAWHAFPAPRGVVPATLVRRPHRYRRPDSLQSLEDVVALGQADNFDLHFRLRPILQEIAADALLSRAGAELYADAAVAEKSLSSLTWSLVRPDRPRPQGAHQRGMDTPALTAIVVELEGMLPT